MEIEEEQSSGCCCCLPCCKHHGPPKRTFRNIDEGRGCTDIIFLAAFIALWGAIAMIPSLAADAGGNLDRLTKGTDMYGRICGVDDGVQNAPFAAWPWPEYYDINVCLESCNDTMKFPSDVMPIPYPTTEWLGFCLPDLAATGLNLTATFLEFSGDYGSMFADAMTDLYNSSDVIMAGCGAALVISLLTVFLLTLPGVVCCLVLSWIPLIVIALGYGGYALYLISGEENSDLTAQEQDYALYTAYAVWVIDFIFVCVIIALRERIRIAIAVVKEAANALLDMPALLLFPVFGVGILLAYFLLWIYVAAIIYTVSTESSLVTPTEVLYLGGSDSFGESARNTNPLNYTSYDFDTTWENVAWFHWFGFLWNVQFMIYMCYLVFAGATADWYFTRKDPESGKKKLRKCIILQSIKRSLCHHIGTVALTSFIIAVIQFIRSVVLYIEKTTASEHPNQVQKAIFMCIQCCLKCVECCMDKINKNALQHTAIYGSNFATSACESFALIWANLGRVAAVNGVSYVIILVAKLFIAASSSACVAYVLLYVDPYSTYVTSILMPCFMMFLLAYSIASMFMTVYLSMIDGIFYCFLVDEKENKNVGDGMYAPKELLELVDDNAAKSKEHAAKAKKIQARRKAAAKKVAPVSDDAE